MRDRLATMVLLISTAFAMWSVATTTAMVLGAEEGMGSFRFDMGSLPFVLLLALSINWALRRRAARHSEFADGMRQAHFALTLFLLPLYAVWAVASAAGWLPQPVPALAMWVIFVTTALLAAAQLFCAGCLVACAIGYPWPSRAVVN